MELLAFQFVSIESIDDGHDHVRVYQRIGQCRTMIGIIGQCHVLRRVGGASSRLESQLILLVVEMNQARSVCACTYHEDIFSGSNLGVDQSTFRVPFSCDYSIDLFL